MSEIERSLEEALSDAAAALVHAEEARAAWEIRVRELKIEVAGLEAAIRRQRSVAEGSLALPLPSARPGEAGRSEIADNTLNPAVPDAALLPEAGSDPAVAAGVTGIVLVLLGMHRNWTKKKRVSVVESVLGVAGRPVHRAEIAEALLRLGRTTDTLDYVSAALAHLNREGRAHALGGGYWSAGPAGNVDAEH